MKDPFDASQIRGRIAIVGNGEVKPPLHQQIEEADYIVRFNNPSIEMLGGSTRTDLLVMCNSGKQVSRRLASPSWPTLSMTKLVILPYHPDIISKYMPKPSLLSYIRGARADQSKPCVKACEEAGKPYYILTSQMYLGACKALGIGKKSLHRCFPSSGMMLIYALISQLDRPQLDIFGFGFKGWKRHNWKAEKAYVDSLLALQKAALWQ